MELPLRPCVGIVLLNSRGRIFAGQRIDGYPEAWQMPQGGIDSDETPSAASLRELGEETGLPPDAVSLLAASERWYDYELPSELQGRTWGGRFRGQTQKWFVYRLVAKENAIDITANREPEFRCWAWFRADALIERIVPFKRPVYEGVLAEFSALLA